MNPLGLFLLGLTAASIVKFVFKVLMAVGLGYVTYTGFGDIYDTVQGEIAAGFGALPPPAVILNIMGFREALSIIVSALSVRLGLMGVVLATGVLTRWQFRPPQATG